jgi:hypothetical protein
MDENQPFALNGAYPSVPGQRVLFHNNDEYQTVVTGSSLVIHKRKGDLLVPVAALGTLRSPDNGDGTGITIWDSDLGHRLVPGFYPSFFAGKTGNNYTWTDTNGDGLVQSGEMNWIHVLSGNDSYSVGSQPTALNGWGFAIGDDFSIYWSGVYKNQSFIFRLDVKGWTSEGAPIYDIHDSKPIVVRAQNLAPQGLFATHDGKVVATYSYEFAPPSNAIECFSRDGQSLWSIAMPKLNPGGSGQGAKDIVAQNVITEFKVPGIGNVLGSWLWHGNFHPYLFTDDGLYVSSLLDETRIGPTAAWDESYKSYYQDPAGTPYIINGGTDAFHVLKIDGLTQGGRFEQPFTYTQQDSSKAAAFRSIPAAMVAPKPIVNVAWVPQPPKIDGELSDWNMRAGASLQGPKGRSAQVALTRDANNLYVAYQVTKERPFSNKGTNWQTLFLSGDAVDLMLSTNASTGQHSDPAAGDIRLLFSEYQGKPVAVLYRPVVPGTSQPVQLMAARIDSIRQLSSARVSIQPKGNSYVVEAAIPLSDIGLDPKSLGNTHYGDVGVIFSDASGGNRDLRLYYYNKQTTTTADLTTEATLQPANWGAVQMPLGSNLLKDSSFENGLITDSNTGWSRGPAGNGGKADTTGASPHSGAQSLTLLQTTPIVYPAAAFNEADYTAFLKSGNNGAGGSQATAVQRVQVTAGHSYTFRFYYRTAGMHIEQRNPGPGRGYAGLSVLIEWSGTGIPPAQKYVGVLDDKTDSPNWTQATNTSSRYQVMAKPYMAPAGATGAIITFRLATNFANDLPTAYVDDVEMVDVTAGP